LEVNGAFSFGPPKSDAGRRTVNLPATVLAALRKHLDTYVGPAPEALVFTSENNANLRRSNFRRRIWREATKQAGIPELRFHDLRHTAGTLAARTGATLREVMNRLGHSSSAAAMRYQHGEAARDAEIARALDDLIPKPKGTLGA
jgi:integrase